MNTAHPPASTARFETAPQFFSQWRDHAGAGGIATQDAIKVLSTRDTEHAGWTVSMSALEAVRIEERGVAPLSMNAIAERGVPSSRLHARVSWMRAGQGTFIDLDIGTGFRLCIEGCGLDVEILGPTGLIREPQKNDTRALGSGGIYLDTLLSGQALGVALDPVLPNTLTQSINVPGNTSDLPVPLPRFAKRLQAYAPQTGAFKALSYQLGENGPDLAQVGFDAFGTTADHLVPQVATHLSTGAPTRTDRRLTLVWTLEF